MLRKAAARGHTGGFHSDGAALPARAGEPMDLREDRGKEEWGLGNLMTASQTSLPGSVWPRHWSSKGFGNHPAQPPPLQVTGLLDCVRKCTRVPKDEMPF